MAKSKENRVIIILECTNCVQKDVNKESLVISRYITQKNRHKMFGQSELRKFCPYCQAYNSCRNKELNV